ncbi:MAG: hypothetical protein IJ371_05635, partial [Clostridia bacterium]|nr:hypothetical protein [Clostridia bacterium]
MDLPIQFLNRMKKLLPDYEDFVASYNQPSVKSFFINTNKISEQEFLDKCDWDISKYANGYILNDDIKVGKT